MSLPEFWSQLVGHIAFLLCVLPLFGASMVAASAGLGREAARRTALTNVLLTAALSCVMVASYDPQRHTPDGSPGLIQMATYLPWIGGDAVPGDADPEASGGLATRPRSALIALTLGIDGLSLWPIALTCWLMLAVVLMGTDVDGDRAGPFYVALLLLQSLLIAAFAAVDAMLFVFCVEASALPLWYLVGRFGGPARQAAARKLFAFLLAGGLALFVGILGMAVAAAAGAAQPGDPPAAAISFFIPRLLAQPLVAGWIAAAVVLGLWIRAGLFPLHTWHAPAFSAAPTSVRILLAASVVPLGGYGLARFVLPLFTSSSGPAPPVSVASSIQALAIAGAVYCGLLALAQSDLSRLVAYAGSSHVALATAGLTSGNRIGATGGLLHVLNLGVTTAVLAILLGWLERTFASDDIRSFGGLARERPRFATALTLAALGLISVPGLNGFAGLLLIVWGVATGSGGDPHLARAAACLLALLLCAWAMIAMLVRLLFGVPHVPAAFPFAHSRSPAEDPLLPGIPAGRIAPADLGRRELAAIVPLLALMLWIGLGPRFFTDRIEPTLAQVVPVNTALQPRDETRYAAGPRPDPLPLAPSPGSALSERPLHATHPESNR